MRTSLEELQVERTTQKDLRVDALYCNGCGSGKNERLVSEENRYVRNRYVQDSERLKHRS